MMHAVEVLDGWSALTAVGTQFCQGPQLSVLRYARRH
jgi:hypothetical protein